MINDLIQVSVIIPTHNRVGSILRLLNKLGEQTFPLSQMEVIVVANSCNDNTIDVLKEYKAPYHFQYAETNGAGPAVPRNKGATMASGGIFIFLDDDVDPSTSLVHAHVSAHNNSMTVVMGYLPLTMPHNPDFFRLNLRAWWEKKFYQMRIKGYRFSYEDLLSGNFSISSSLFRQADGFITTFTCRDDYELGIRLLQLGAQFVFSKDAWGVHCDEVTNLIRSLRRKREEGRTDVKLWRLHPGIQNELQKEYTAKGYDFLQSKTAFFLIKWPMLSDSISKSLELMLQVLERIKMRYRWEKLSYKLHTYWYYRGLLDELGTKENLKAYLTHNPGNYKSDPLEIDLQMGIGFAEKMLDEKRPDSLRIKLHNQVIGEIPVKGGAEPIKGEHLRRMLAKELSKPLMKVLSLEVLKQKTQ
ncbi:MAG TPA: glycosyltransferase family A protein [Flavisolibacter sp.]|nr:glycosyltransferase family A protein [Flavisolibacter sp.]